MIFDVLLGIAIMALWIWLGYRSFKELKRDYDVTKTTGSIMATMKRQKFHVLIIIIGILVPLSYIF